MRVSIISRHNSSNRITTGQSRVTSKGSVRIPRHWKKLALQTLLAAKIQHLNLGLTTSQFKWINNLALDNSLVLVRLIIKMSSQNQVFLQYKSIRKCLMVVRELAWMVSETSHHTKSPLCFSSTTAVLITSTFTNIPSCRNNQKLAQQRIRMSSWSQSLQLKNGNQNNVKRKLTTINIFAIRWNTRKLRRRQIWNQLLTVCSMNANNSSHLS